jgi:hypothetical protein
MKRPRCALLWKSLLIVPALAGCAPDSDEEVEIEFPPPTQVPDPRPLVPGSPAVDPERSRLELEVNLEARELHVYRGGTPIATYPVAVGSEDWPTPTGEWTIHEVVWNPRWTPPEEAWAVDEVERDPGDPRNPLGKAQLVYDLPNSIHGTSDTSSLGKAASHGSIRVSNAVATDLARQVMAAGGARRDAEWFRMVEENPREEHRVPLPNPVTIRVLSRAGPGASPTR